MHMQIMYVCLYVYVCIYIYIYIYIAHFRYSRSRVSPTAVIQGNKPTSKFNEVSRFHLHISWPVRQPGGQPTLRDSSQNAPTSRRSNTLTP